MNASLNIGRLMLALFSIVLPLMAQGQDSASAAAGPLRYYQVEILVFRHLDQSTTTGEIPRMPEPEMTQLLEQDLARLAGDPEAAINASDPLNAPADMQTETTTRARFIKANTDRLLLKNTARSIGNLSAYEVVSYLNWGQTATDVTASKAFDVAELGADPDLLSGSIELHQRRYLHLTLELTLEESGPAETSYADSQQLPRGTAALPVIKDSRRIRLEKFQYFDQPSFGVIAVVSRLE